MEREMRQVPVAALGETWDDCRPGSLSHHSIDCRCRTMTLRRRS